MVKDIGGNRTDLRKRIDDLREALIEIRDIAQKVGRMVNMEMNRNMNSSVRGA